MEGQTGERGKRRGRADILISDDKDIGGTQVLQILPNLPNGVFPIHKKESDSQQQQQQMIKKKKKRNTWWHQHHSECWNWPSSWRRRVREGERERVVRDNLKGIVEISTGGIGSCSSSSRSSSRGDSPEEGGGNGGGGGGGACQEREPGL